MMIFRRTYVEIVRSATSCARAVLAQANAQQDDLPS
jgi:hypothetical protein